MFPVPQNACLSEYCNGAAPPTPWLGPQRETDGSLRENFKLIEYTGLWSLPSDAYSHEGLAGGITFAIHPLFCEQMKPRFPEESQGAFGVSFLSCDRLRQAVLGAFNTWAINHKRIHFEDVTKACWSQWTEGETTECPNAELLITTDQSYTGNLGGLDVSNFAAFVQNQKLGGGREPTVVPALTSGVQLAQGKGLTRSQMTISTGICWYLDTTFCYHFHSLNDAGWDVVLLMRILISFICVACACIMAYILIAGLKQALHPRKKSRNSASNPGKVFGKRCDALLFFLARMPLFALLFSLFFLIAAPTFYFMIFLPCWDCYDFKATVAHEVGHVLGFDHPDANSNLNLRATVEMGPQAVCEDPLSPKHVEYAPLPEGHDSIMYATTRHRSRTCLTKDDLEGLNFLYPTCNDGLFGSALDEPECLDPLELSGYLRFTLAIGGPYIIASLVIAVVQCCVGIYMKRRARHLDDQVTILQRDASRMADEQMALRMRIRALGGSMTPRDGSKSARPNSARIWDAFGRGSRSVVSLMTPRGGAQTRGPLTPDSGGGMRENSYPVGFNPNMDLEVAGAKNANFEMANENRMSVVRESEREGAVTAEFNRNTFEYEFDEDSSSDAPSGEISAVQPGAVQPPAASSERASSSALHLNRFKLESASRV